LLILARVDTRAPRSESARSTPNADGKRNAKEAAVGCPKTRRIFHLNLISFSRRGSMLQPLIWRTRGSTAPACSSPKAYGSLSVSSRTFQVRATDEGATPTRLRPAASGRFRRRLRTAAPRHCQRRSGSWIDQASPSSSNRSDPCLHARMRPPDQAHAGRPQAQLHWAGGKTVRSPFQRRAQPIRKSSSAADGCLTQEAETPFSGRWEALPTASEEGKFWRQEQREFLKGSGPSPASLALRLTTTTQPAALARARNRFSRQHLASRSR
jgi:hypothetical protein